MDVYTKDFTVAVSGNYPKITIRNGNGDSPQIENIVDTHAFLVSTYLLKLSHNNKINLVAYKMEN